MDTELWDRIRQGDKDAFMQLYQQQYQQLYTFGCRVHARQELVKDCIHEMFCELWNKRHHLQQVSNSRAYLCTYLKRKILKEIQIVNPTIFNTSDGINADMVEPSYEEALVQLQTDEESKAKLQQVLNRLTKTQAEIIKLKYYEGLTYEQIATILQVQPRTIYNQVYEALKLLRTHMKSAFLPLALYSSEIFKNIFF